MNILVLNGSPKAKSDTLRLTDAFLKGIRKTGGHDIKVIDVIKQKIAPCRGCFGCWQRSDGHCVIEDDQNKILDLYRAADLIIWSFPLYCYGMPSHLKAVLDRTIPLITMKMVESPDGTVRHVPLVDFSKIHTVVISGCGFPDWDGNFNGLKESCRQSFGNLTMICVPETPLMNVPEAAGMTEPLLRRFEAAGQEYAMSFSLSPETAAGLEEPMIPKKEYLKHINGNAQ